MAYSILGIVDGDNTDGSVFPVLSEGGAYPIELEELDVNVQEYPISLVEVLELVGSTTRQVVFYPKIDATLLVTDARVVVFCRKYDKGSAGSFIYADPITPLLLIGGAKLMAAHRRRGKVLAGQVRYPWLFTVGAMEKAGIISGDGLRLRVKAIEDGPARNLFLTVGATRRLDTVAIAQDIARRAAAYRLTYTKIDTEEERERFEALARVPRLNPARKEWAYHVMGGAWPVSRGSAYPRSGTEPGAAACPQGRAGPRARR
jgi:hypothetical protein